MPDGSGSDRPGPPGQDDQVVFDSVKSPLPQPGYVRLETEPQKAEDWTVGGQYMVDGHRMSIYARVVFYAIVLASGILSGFFLGLYASKKGVDDVCLEMKRERRSMVMRERFHATSVQAPDFEDGVLIQYLKADRIETEGDGIVLFTKPVLFELWPGTKKLKSRMSADEAEMVCEPGQISFDYKRMTWKGNLKYESYERKDDAGKDRAGKDG